MPLAVHNDKLATQVIQHFKALFIVTTPRIIVGVDHNNIINI